MKKPGIILWFVQLSGAAAVHSSTVQAWFALQAIRERWYFQQFKWRFKRWDPVGDRTRMDEISRSSKMCAGRWSTVGQNQGNKFYKKYCNRVKQKDFDVRCDGQSFSWRNLFIWGIQTPRAQHVAMCLTKARHAPVPRLAVRREQVPLAGRHGNYLQSQ